MDERLIVSVSPHIRSARTTQKIMLDVIIALVPALIASVFFFSARTLLITGVCVAACVGSEWLFCVITKRRNTIGDLSAVVTGLMLAYNLPVTIPLWQAAVGSVIAIVVVKELFGGLGQNFANPAITARIIMLLAFSDSMTNWATVDGVTSATPLAQIASGDMANLPGLWEMVLGSHGGCIGETASLLLIAGGIYLLARKVITWHIPVAFIGTVLVLGAVFGMMPLYQVFGGGVIIGAFFMATDYATSPPTKWGRIIFGFGCGLFTMLIRKFGNYPEGVSFSILLMNIITPYITKWTATRPFGGGRA